MERMKFEFKLTRIFEVSMAHELLSDLRTYKELVFKTPDVFEYETDIEYDEDYSDDMYEIILALEDNDIEFELFVFDGDDRVPYLR